MLTFYFAILTLFLLYTIQLYNFYQSKIIKLPSPPNICKLSKPPFWGNPPYILFFPDPPPLPPALKKKKKKAQIFL